MALSFLGETEMIPDAQCLGVTFRQSVSKFPNSTALRFSDGADIRQLSFAEVDREIKAWMVYLRGRGLKLGDRVAAISPKSPNHYRMFYACWNLGLIAVPVCETLSDQEMAFIIQDCEPAIILADDSCLKRATANAGNFPVVNWNDIPLESTESAENAEFSVDEVAALIYTSGSTGMPKGVMLTHRNLWVNAYSILENYHVSPKDNLFSVLPYWHAFALSTEICCTMMSGACLSIPKDIRDFKKNLSKYQPSFILVVPRVVDGLKAALDKAIRDAKPRQRALIEKAIYNASRIFTAGPELNGGILRYVTHYLFYDPLIFRRFRKAFGGRLRAIVSGGAPLDLEQQIFFKYIGISLLQGYGLSEASPVVSSNLWDRHRLGSCGPVMTWLLPENGGDYTFKDEDGNLGKNLHGQLLIKGQCVMKGYWRHTDASAKTMENGWLNTGDMGHCDANGYLFIHGRKGNMIVLNGGEKLHPEHVEDAVKNSPLVSEAMVIGDKCKNVYVCVNVPKEVRAKHTPEELHDLLKEDLVKYTKDLTPLQKPKDVLVLPDFSMDDGTLTATFKVRRYKIMEKYRPQIEEFLMANGEEIATKRELSIASSKVLESLDAEDAIVGLDNGLK